MVVNKISNNKLMNKRTIIKIWLATLFLFPFILWLLPSDFFDNSVLTLCPSKLFFDFECYGCGISRAVMHFHHLEFDEAVYFNPLVLGVYPFLVGLWFKWVYDAAKFLNVLPAALVKHKVNYN